VTGNLDKKVPAGQSRDTHGSGSGGTTSPASFAGKAAVWVGSPPDVGTLLLVIADTRWLFGKDLHL
jgi:hypothetical protein